MLFRGATGGWLNTVVLIPKVFNSCCTLYVWWKTSNSELYCIMENFQQRNFHKFCGLIGTHKSFLHENLGMPHLYYDWFSIPWKFSCITVFGQIVVSSSQLKVWLLLTRCFEDACQDIMRNRLAFFQSFDPFLNTVSTNGPQSSCCFTIASHHIGVQVLHNNNITNRSKLSNYAWYYESYWKERFHCCSSVSFQCMCQ